MKTVLDNIDDWPAELTGTLEIFDEGGSETDSLESYLESWWGSCDLVLGNERISLIIEGKVLIDNLILPEEFNDDSFFKVTIKPIPDLLKYTKVKTFEVVKIDRA